MATVTFRRTADVDSIPIVDGSLVFDLSRNKIYMDNGNTRIQYGGDTDLISSVNAATGQNAFSATATVATFLQKTSVINTKASALSVTQNNIPLGCLAFKEALGTNNYSGIGDGTVSGALTNLNSRVGTSQSGVNDLVSQLKASGTSFYFDYKDGKWGWNSSPARGAGTFHPFKTSALLSHISSGRAPASDDDQSLSGTLVQTGRDYDYICCFGISTGDGVNRYGAWNFTCSSGTTAFSQSGYYSGGSAAIFQNVSGGSTIGWSATRVGSRPPQRDFYIYGFTT